MRPKGGERAENETHDAGEGIEKQVARRAVNFFDHGPNIQQHHHVETDMDQTAVEKHGGNQAIHLALPDGWSPQSAEAVKNFVIEPPQNAQAAALPGLDGGHHADATHQDINDKQGGGDGRAPAKISGEALTQCRH